jgi:hypothetical protein
MMDRLEQAVTSLLETQIAMQNQLTVSQANFQTQMTKLAERQVDNDKRWFEIREKFNQVIMTQSSHTKILERLTELLQDLPERVKEKVGFKP